MADQYEELRTHGISRRDLVMGGAGITAAMLAPALPAWAAALRDFWPRGAGDVSHEVYDRILRANVMADGNGFNRVDYRAMKRSHAELKSYISGMEAEQPSGFSAAAAHAFWINLYNAKTLDIVLDHYPVSSIRKINLGGGGLFGSGPWSKAVLSVDGHQLSLDDIEHKIVRSLFGDPLSHYALNCASYSCPNLSASAYTSANLKILMAENAVAYVNHDRGVAISGADIVASKIYSWYAGDFGGTAGLKDHWIRFAHSGRFAGIRGGRIAGYKYDWTLNDVTERNGA